MGGTTGRMDSAEQPNKPKKVREVEGPRGLEINDPRRKHRGEHKTIRIKSRDPQTQPFSNYTSTYAKQRVQCSCNFE
jgi:hypothetical protein